MRDWGAVFVSPHLDDVALSCPGRVLAERAGGRRVLVVSVYTRGDGEARRKAEDRAALAQLGAEALHLDGADAPERRAHPAAFRALVLQERARDAADAAALAAELTRLLGARGGCRVYAPLGVGGHVDHRIVHAAAAPLADYFYEDRPYALVGEAVGARLRELGADAPVDAAAYRRALASAAHLRAYLPPGAERDACIDELVARASSPAARDGTAFAAREHALTRDDVERARLAVACYASQLAELFAGDWPAAAYARERLWTTE